MLKLFAKIFCPSSRTLAEAAVNKIQNGVNGISANNKALLARYATTAREVGEIGQRLATMLTDGEIDESEKEMLVAYLVVLVDKAKKIVFE